MPGVGWRCAWFRRLPHVLDVALDRCAILVARPQPLERDQVHGEGARRPLQTAPERVPPRCRRNAGERAREPVATFGDGRDELVVGRGFGLGVATGSRRREYCNGKDRKYPSHRVQREPSR